MAMKKITKRWMVNSLSVILIILAALVLALSLGIHTFYYNSVRQSILTRSSSLTTLLETYSQDSSVNFTTQVRRMVESFSDRDRMELMAIDAAGSVIITSSGFETGEKMEMPDFPAALDASDGVGEYQGNLNGENVMAITIASNLMEEDLAAIRFVVSLDLVDQQIGFLSAAVAAVGVAIIFFVGLSSSYFINSIVNPIGEVGETARKIAQGDFGVRLEKQTDDEIGSLCEIINYMAEELQNAEKLKNDFISSVSHELRTPLTAIKGWGETLLVDGTDKETLHTGISVILRETDRLSGMVEELLDFSRMQSGRMKLVMSKMDLLAELSEAVLMYTERAKREDIALLYDEPDLIAPVFGDRNRLRQVFINVIDNAIKYSDPGDSVTVTVEQAGEEYRITVQDTGCGISPQDLPKIKTKFYKANLTRRGSGIGLAVADEIISMHSGHLEVDSVLGEGTAVVITLPVLSKRTEELTQITQTGELGSSIPKNL